MEAFSTVFARIERYEIVFNSGITHGFTENVYNSRSEGGRCLAVKLFDQMMSDLALRDFYLSRGRPSYVLDNPKHGGVTILMDIQL